MFVQHLLSRKKKSDIIRKNLYVLYTSGMERLMESHSLILTMWKARTTQFNRKMALFIVNAK